MKNVFALDFNDLLCSTSRPYNFILFASCWAFFFSRHALEANLFFSLRDFGLTLKGSSLTGVISLIMRPNLSNSFPIICNFFGFGVKSLPSPFRAFPLCCFKISSIYYYEKIYLINSYTSIPIRIILKPGKLFRVLYFICQSTTMTCSIKK